MPLHKPMPRVRVFAGPIGAALLAVGFVPFAGTANGQDAGTAADASTRDPRIDPAKVGAAAEPPDLPEMVLLPLPPDHRIAAEASQVPVSPAAWAAAESAIRKGMTSLIRSQNEAGGWMANGTAAPTPDPNQTSDERPVPVGLAVTGLAMKALIQAERLHSVPVRAEHAGDGGVDTDDAAPLIAPEMAAAYAARRLLLDNRTDTGIWGEGSLSNYVTSLVVSGLAAWQDFDLRPMIATAVGTLQTNQWDDGEGIDRGDDWYGGAGYGNRGRPDLSNTQLMLEALYDAGLSPDEPAFQRALVFLARTQNLAAKNPAEWAGNDGGFVYTPAGGGESMASEAAGEGRRGEKSVRTLGGAETADGSENTDPGPNVLPGDGRSLRSYGSMSYAGFKSMLYAGMSASDLRVRAVFDWISQHLTFDENPGLGQQGLYYYWFTAARALRISQQVEIVTPDGTSINWREALIEAITSRQRADGSWRNDADRWLEGESPLATSYALLALEEALKPVTFPDRDPDAPLTPAADGG